VHDASTVLRFNFNLGRMIGFGGGDFEGKGVTLGLALGAS